MLTCHVFLVNILVSGYVVALPQHLFLNQLLAKSLQDDGNSLHGTHSPVIMVANEPLVEENSPPEQIVALITVTDEDSGAGGVVDCTTEGHLFHLRQHTYDSYTLETRVVLDREQQDRYAVLIQCADHGDPAMTSVQTVDVRVVDDNDNMPIFSMASYIINVIENTLPGTDILQTSAMDQDEGDNGELTYRLSTEMGELFDVDAISGMISTRYMLDYEEMTSVTFEVLAVDHGIPPRTGTTTVKVDISDENDNAPEFTKTLYRFTAFTDQPVIVPFGYVSAWDADGEQFNYFQFSILDDNVRGPFNIRRTDERTCEVFATQSLEAARDTVYRFTIIAIDEDNQNLNNRADVEITIF